MQKVKDYTLIFLATFLISAPLLYGDASLHISVRYPDGKPASGIPIREVGLDRANLDNQLAGKTDTEGRFTLVYKDRKYASGTTRGYGVYRYILMPDDYRWEISDIYHWDGDSPDDAPQENQHPAMSQNFSDRQTSLQRLREEFFQKTDNLAKGGSNWLLGDLVRLSPDKPAQWKIVLNPGRTQSLCMKDQFDQPIRHFPFAISVDLEIDSHTGYGGSVPIKNATTDENGCIQMKHVGEFYYTFASQNYFRYYLPDYSERVGERFCRFTDRNNVLVFKKADAKSLQVYVKDKETGKPIQNAQIGVVMNFPASAQGGPIGCLYDHCEESMTDANGFYSTHQFQTDHVVSFHAYKDGYRIGSIPIDQYEEKKVFLIELEREKP